MRQGPDDKTYRRAPKIQTRQNQITAKKTVLNAFLRRHNSMVFRFTAVSE